MRIAIDCQQYFAGHVEDKAVLLFDTGLYLEHLRRFDESKDYYNQSLNIYARASHPRQPEMARVLEQLGALEQQAGDFRSAAAAFQAALDIVVKLNEVAEQLRISAQIGPLLADLGQLEKAEERARRSLELVNSLPQGDHTAILNFARLSLAQVLIKGARLDEAVPLLRQIREGPSVVSSDLNTLREKALVLAAEVELRRGNIPAADVLLTQLEHLPAPESSLTKDRQSTLDLLKGILCFRQGRYPEADGYYRAALDGFARIYGERHVMVARVARAMGIMAEYLDDRVSASSLHERALAIMQKALGSAAPDTLATELRLAFLDLATGKSQEAAIRAHHILHEIAAQDRPDRFLVGLARYSVGSAAFRQGDLDAADRELRDAISDIKTANGSAAPELYQPMLSLADLQLARKHYQLAKATLLKLREVLASNEQSSPSKLSEIAVRMAAADIASGNRVEGLSLLREAAEAATQRALAISQYYNDVGDSERKAYRRLFLAYLKTVHPVDFDKPIAESVPFDEEFQIAQAAQVSVTARSVDAMSARFASHDDNLGRLLRERQDALERLRALERGLVYSDLESSKSRARSNSELIRTEMKELTSKIATMSNEVLRNYPRFAELEQPRSVSLAEIQKLLRPRELILLVLCDADSSFVFTVTKQSAAVRRGDVTGAEVTTLVKRVRKSLDVAGVTDARKLPAYDTEAAFSLYERLIGPSRAELEGIEHIIYLPDGALQSLPLGILIDEAAAGDPNDTARYRSLSWLARKYRISTFPSLTAFRSLRTIAGRSSAPKPFVGFGNPALRGEQGNSGGGPSRSATGVHLYRSPSAKVFRTTGAVDLGVLKLLEPLPETAAELRSLNASLGGAESDLFLGNRATVRNVRLANLKQYRVIAFATHALMAGEFHGLAEPGIVLTPPAKVTSEDSGLLLEDDIAGLELDADWVVLSACNTASGDGSPGAEGLSGLARAFFYAGARTLLVSHWAVASDSAAQLTTGTFAKLSKDSNLSKGEALRQTIAELIDGEDGTAFSHPLFWGPFVIVGDGAQTL